MLYLENVMPQIPDRCRPRVNLEFLGFPDYEVDAVGVVWSCREKGVDAYTDWHPKKQWPSKKGYMTVQLCNNGVRKSYQVHALVLLAYIGPRPDNKQETRHLNGIKTDNRLANLCWGTSQENSDDQIPLGEREKQSKKMRGKGNPAAVLTQEEVNWIRSVYKPRSERRQTDRKALKRDGNPEYKKYTIKKLAALFSVSESCISFVVYDMHWKDTDLGDVDDAAPEQPKEPLQPPPQVVAAMEALKVPTVLKIAPAPTAARVR